MASVQPIAESARALTPEQQAFKEKFFRDRAYWKPMNEGFLVYSPQWQEDYLEFANAPFEEGPLPARMRELLHVAVDASTTHMFSEGTYLHCRQAIRYGATAGDLIQVMQLTVMQCLSSVSAGVEILAEEIAAAGGTMPRRAASATVATMRATYEAIFGDWPGWMDQLAWLSPHYAAKLIKLMETSERDATLSPKERTLIALGLAASPTMLDRATMRTETRRAIALGASPEELIQTVQYVSQIAVHSCLDGVPAAVAAIEA